MADGTQVRFIRQGEGKSSSNAKGDILLRAVPAIRSIIENGTVVLRDPGKAGLIERLVIAGRVRIGTAAHDLAVSVHRAPNGHYHCDLTID